MYNILLVEDSETCHYVANRALSKPDIELTWNQSIQQAIQTLDSHKTDFDLVLLDLVLADGDGLTVLNHMQGSEELRDIPVLLLTSKEDLASKVSAFSMGADDYLTKPIHAAELWVRVETRLRKSILRKKPRDIIKRGNISINISLMRVTIQENGVNRDGELTSKEFKILAYLMQNENRLFTRGQLVKAIWGKATHVIERTVDSHVCGLRRKLGNQAHYIENIPGAGYRFIDRTKLEK